MGIVKEWLEWLLQFQKVQLSHIWAYKLKGRKQLYRDARNFHGFKILRCIQFGKIADPNTVVPENEGNRKIVPIWHESHAGSPK